MRFVGAANGVASGRPITGANVHRGGATVRRAKLKLGGRYMHNLKKWLLKPKYNCFVILIYEVILLRRDQGLTYLCL